MTLIGIKAFLKEREKENKKEKEREREREREREPRKFEISFSPFVTLVTLCRVSQLCRNFEASNIGPE